MKRFLILLYLSCFVLYSFGADNINVDFPMDENIENQLSSVFPILDYAKKNNDIEAYYEASVKGYNTKKVGNSKNIKIYNDIFSASAIEYSLQKYELTKEKKYLSRAYKWSKIAVKDRTSQVYAIKTDIALASLFLEPQEMTKAYDLYRAIDLKGAKQFQTEYMEAYEATLAYKKENNANIRAKWINGIKKIMYFVCVGVSGMGSAYSNAAYNTKPINTHCYSIGDHVYCNSY